MSLKGSACAEHLANNLNELKKQRELESLRQYLIEENCFPIHSNPKTCSITIEELRKLARAWKMPDRRNYNKGNTSLMDLVYALLQLLHTNRKLQKKIREQVLTATPTAPTVLKSSKGNDLRLKNIFGLKYFNKEINDSEFSIRSRMNGYPDNAKTIVSDLVNEWRIEDFKARDDTFQLEMPNFDSPNASLVPSKSNSSSTLNLSKPIMSTNRTKEDEKSDQSSQSSESSLSNIFHKKAFSNTSDTSAIQKHRTLAGHLARYSASPEFKPAELTLQSAQTFVSLSEKGDTLIATYSVISLANISYDARVRSLLFECNAVLNVSNILPFLKSQKAIRAAAIFFFYFSCESDIEDRIFNASINTIQVNGQSNDEELSLMSLYTLNNLLSCVDKETVSSSVVAIFKSVVRCILNSQDINTETLIINCNIIENCSKFNTNHSTLAKNELLKYYNLVLDALEQLPCDRAEGIRLIIIRTILNLSLSCYAYSVTIVNEIISICFRFLKYSNQELEMFSFRIFACMSSHLTVLPLIRSEIVTKNLISIVQCFDGSKPITANYAAICLANMCCTTSHEILENMIVYRVPQTIIHIIELYKDSNHQLCNIAIHGIQNIMSYPFQNDEILKVCYNSIMYMIEKYHDIGAINSLLNLTNCEEYRDRNIEYLVYCQCHIRILNYINSTDNIEAKVTCLTLIIGMLSYDFKFNCKEQSESVKHEEGKFFTDYEGINESSKLRARECAMDLVNYGLFSKLELAIQSFGHLHVDHRVWLLLSELMKYIVSLEPQVFLPENVKSDNFHSNNDNSVDDKPEITPDPAVQSIILSKESNKNTSRYKSRHRRIIAQQNIPQSCHPNVRSIQKICLCILDKIPVDLLNSQSQQLSTNTSSTLSVKKIEIDVNEIRNSSEQIVFGVLKLIGSMSEHLNEYQGISPILLYFLELIDLIKPFEKSLHTFAIIIYNLSCNSASNKSSVDLLVSNKYFLTELLDLMRCNFLEIQLLLANTLRNFCAQAECNQFLIDPAVLSDLIVIALLRTSHITMKNICIEISYNMLCTEKSRIELLKREELDLWWSIHRLSKYPSKYVKYISTNALYGLSMETSFSKIMRDHHALTFLRELIQDICLIEEKDLVFDEEDYMSSLVSTSSNSPRLSILESVHTISPAAFTVGDDLSSLEINSVLGGGIGNTKRIDSKASILMEERHNSSSMRDMEHCQRCLTAAINTISHIQQKYFKDKEEKMQNHHHHQSDRTRRRSVIKKHHTLSSSDVGFFEHELIAMFRIASTVLKRMYNAASTSSALSILLTACQYKSLNKDILDAEIIHLDMIDHISASRTLWKEIPIACVHSSGLIYQIVHRSEHLLKSISISHCFEIWDATLSMLPCIVELSIADAQKLCEFICSTMLLFLSKNKVGDLIVFKSFSSLKCLFAAVFGNPLNPYLHFISKYIYGRLNTLENPFAKHAPSPANRGFSHHSRMPSGYNSRVPSRPVSRSNSKKTIIGEKDRRSIQGFAMTSAKLPDASLLEKCVPCTIETRATAIACVYYLCEVFKDNPDMIDSSLITSIMTKEHITDSITRDYVVLVMLVMSKTSELAVKLIQSCNVFELIHQYIISKTKDMTISDEHVQAMKVKDVCSAIIRNISQTKSTLPVLLIPDSFGSLRRNSSDNKSCVMELIDSLLDASYNRLDSVDNGQSTHSNISIFLYNVVTGHVLKEDYNLTPQYILSVLQTITLMTVSKAKKNQTVKSENSESTVPVETVNKPTDKAGSAVNLTESGDHQAIVNDSKDREINLEDDSSVSSSDSESSNSSLDDNDDSTDDIIPESKTLSKMSLPMITKETMSISKFVINEILEKYPGNVAVSPDFIQSLFTEVISNVNQNMPQILTQSKRVDTSMAVIDLYNTKESIDALLNNIKPIDLRFECYTDLECVWKGVIDTEPKKPRKYSNESNSSNTVLSMTLDELEPIELVPYAKYIHTYPAIIVDSKTSEITTNDDAIMEEDNEDDSDDDNHHDHEVKDDVLKALDILVPMTDMKINDNRKSSTVNTHGSRPSTSMRTLKRRPSTDSTSTVTDHPPTVNGKITRRSSLVKRGSLSMKANSQTSSSTSFKLGN